MDVVADLVRARREFEDGAWAAALDVWSGVDPQQMTPRDCEDAGEAAFLLGRRDDALAAWQRTYAAYLEEGDTEDAVRAAFHLAMTLTLSGEPAMGGGWAARAHRLVEDLAEDTVARGYVTFLDMYAALDAGDWPAATEAAETVSRVGQAHHHADLTAVGACSRGRLALYAGRVSEGLAHLDESILCLSSPEVSPIFFGHVYCTAIEGCQELGDLARVAEWVRALSAWVERRPGLLAFTGQCAVHRGQVMCVRGAWAEALEEFTAAVDRYRLVRMPAAVGLAAAEHGDLLRLLGRADEAAAAYRQAGEAGYDPQPGLALLWLATGSAEAALSAVRRLLGEAADPVHRAQRLPGVVEVLLACGELGEAASTTRELERLADTIGSAAVLARAAYAAGSVELAGGDASGALPYLRRARHLWTSLDYPYEVARTQVLLGRALRDVGDATSGATELATAATTFRRLHAAPAVAEVEAVLEPASLPGGLSAREVEVLRLVATGRSNAQVAAELVLSEKTVARHLSNIFTKLDVGTRTAAAAYAYEHDLV